MIFEPFVGGPHIQLHPICIIVSMLPIVANYKGEEREVRICKLALLLEVKPNLPIKKNGVVRIALIIVQCMQARPDERSWSTPRV